MRLHEWETFKEPNYISFGAVGYCGIRRKHDKKVIAYHISILKLEELENVVREHNEIIRNGGPVS